jgi:arginyl-tRNA synthetase
MIKDVLKELIQNALYKAQKENKLLITKLPELELERPKEKNHGDWSTNIAMVLARLLKMPPMEIAQIIVSSLDNRRHFIEKVEVAKPGFINFFLSNNWLYQVLRDIESEQEKSGCYSIGNGLKVQIEFVSANPVGPMHVGHGRWAAVGDVLANLLEASGYDVKREFYINDYGSQMDIFGKSVAARYSQKLGKEVPFPKDGYQGDYIGEIAEEIIEKAGDKYLELSQEEQEEIFKQIAYKQVLEHIKNVLLEMGVHFDNWFSETSLHQSGAIEKVIAELDAKGFVYKKDGATWLKTTDFGDDKDRVLIRENGEPTYFAADIAYHKSKFERGFQKVINIWGADHHGYVKRMKAAIKALGFDPDSVEIIIGQLVNLLRSGEPIRMSKRTGEMITLEELLEEVGKDATRYLFLTRGTDTSVDFDIEIAKAQSNENPVYYVQYAHARISSILRFAQEKGITGISAHQANLNLLNTEWELDLIRKLEQFGEVVEKAVQQRAPYLLTKYAEALASIFHIFYTQCRVISDDIELSMARLVLCKSTQRVLKNVLGLLGVNAPEKM